MYRATDYQVAPVAMVGVVEKAEILAMVDQLIATGMMEIYQVLVQRVGKQFASADTAEMELCRVIRVTRVIRVPPVKDLVAGPPIREGSMGAAMIFHYYSPVAGVVVEGVAWEEQVVVVAVAAVVVISVVAVMACPGVKVVPGVMGATGGWLRERS